MTIKTTYAPGAPFTNCGEFCQWAMTSNARVFRDGELLARPELMRLTLGEVSESWAKYLPAIEKVPEIAACPVCGVIPMAFVNLMGRYECGCRDCFDEGPDTGLWGRSWSDENTKSAAILDWNEQVAEWAESEQEAANG